MTHHTIYCFGYASDIAGAKSGAALGPSVLKGSSYLSELSQVKLAFNWQKMFEPSASFSNKLSEVKTLAEKLGASIAELVQQKKFFMVVGGDHTSAIGTWSGASVLGAIGLIWIDAHMDSHTPDTSETGNLHGMPLACLLGKGESSLVQLFNRAPKLKPENICLIGVRSFERGEAELLQALKVRIFYMDEVRERGLKVVMEDAIKIAKQNTVGYGVTLDVDSIDPLDAPGTGVAEPNGIPGKDLCQALTLLSDDSNLVGVEIAEFDPTRDKNKITEKLIARIVSSLILGKVMTT